MAVTRMVRVADGNDVFFLRAVGVATSDGRVLLHRELDGRFWELPGGRANIGETGAEALCREMREEIGAVVDVGRLLWVSEHFFEQDGNRYHELGLYYAMDVPESLRAVESFPGTEEGTEGLEFRWHRTDQLAALPLRPEFLRNGLRDLPVSPQHVMDRDPGLAGQGAPAGEAPLAFRPASELHAAAVGILATERARLAGSLPDAELVLSGACSVPSALTKGDVDLHLRVPPEAFAGAVETLRSTYRVVLPEIWSDTLATFEVDAPLPTGLAVTPTGSEHDRLFTSTWERLRRRPDMLEAYNDLKRRHAGADEATYVRAKSAFFARLMEDRQS